MKSVSGQLRFFIIFLGEMRVTPSLPQRGRQPKGSIPLTPSAFLPLSRRIIVNLLRGYHIFECPDCNIFRIQFLNNFSRAPCWFLSRCEWRYLPVSVNDEQRSRR